MSTISRKATVIKIIDTQIKLINLEAYLTPVLFVNLLAFLITKYNTRLYIYAESICRALYRQEAMMLRRVYFLSPDVEHAQTVVTELGQVGVDRAQIHTMAREDIDISSLPAATKDQKRDRVWLFDRVFWFGDLAIFAVALLGLVLTLYWGLYLWTVVAAVVMVVTFFLGEIFATKIPHAHLNEAKGALARGEILLMVDVPKHRVDEINGLVSKHHPETEPSGVGWTIQALGT